MVSVVYCIVLLCLTSALWMEAEIALGAAAVVGLGLVVAVSATGLIERTGLLLRDIAFTSEESGFYPIDPRVLPNQMEGAWMWSDGSRFSFRHWGRGEPNNHRGREDCMEMNFRGRNYVNDANCRDRLGFVCSSFLE
ncbi:Galactose-specific lectin nattectin [Dissostichus eleginoides]|uniref:Galactose-specific lectin nattectin n=1 Tax=Dissostichus eleginoides TaxID=100907 RepID=A0AAD9BZE0_DISEL|nr:Galactose-specific lectin nattectin [Dissostichus eleginoides]